MDLKWRPATKDDADYIHRLMLIIADKEKNILTTSLPEIQSLLSDPMINLQEDTLLAFDANDELRAAAWVVPNTQSELLLGLTTSVHPSYQQSEKDYHALDERLFSWVEQRSLKRLKPFRGSSQHAMLIYLCWENQELRRKMVEKHGFFPLRYFYNMQRPLKEMIPQPSSVAGITIISYSSEYDDDLRGAYHVLIKDEWSFRPMDEAEWHEKITRHPGFHADKTFLALKNGEIIGFSINHIHRHGQICEGYITYIGTKAEWRKHGVA